MAFEKFNSAGGYSVGIPPVEVIDENGFVVAEVITSGNVVANVIRGTTFLYANGQPYIPPAGGNTGSLQFNSSGTLGGIPNVTWNGNTLNLGDISTLTIGGGLNGYYLQTDGSGNLTWAAGGSGGNGSPGGVNTQVQFNDVGSFGGDIEFTYNKNTNLLTVGNANITGNITANKFIGNGSLLTGITLDVANYVSQPYQSNITSLGTLDYVDVSGDITGFSNANISGTVYAGNISVSANVYANSADFTNKVRIGSNLTINSNAIMRVYGNVNTSGSPNISLGTLSNIHISGGVNGYVLTTDGTGNLSWAPGGGGGGGNGTPGGSNTQVQYNNNGDFGGDPYFTYDNFNKIVQIGGNLVANSLQIGAGVYKWSSSQVYFATTSSTTPQQVLYSISVTDLSGVDFEIFGTDPSGPSRQSCKISSIYYNGTVQFNEYASLFVNGGVGNFEVDYDPGNIITPASLKLLVTPSTSNPTTYKMLITVYAG